MENITDLIPDILNRYKHLELDVLIVDDNSPDGTGNYVDELSKTNDRIKLISREGKLGLGSAYIAGFRYALDNKYDYIFEMDADYSHSPKEIKNFLKCHKEVRPGSWQQVCEMVLML